MKIYVRDYLPPHPQGEYIFYLLPENVHFTFFVLASSGVCMFENEHTHSLCPVEDSDAMRFQLKN